MEAAAAAVADLSDPDVMSKGDFAVRRNVSPGRVSQWISEGKIFGDGLVGEGRSARIRESVAVGQLRQKLDIVQRMGNGLATRLELPPPAAMPVAVQANPLPSQSAAPPDAPRPDPVEEQIKRERLEQLRRNNRKTAEEEAARAGTLVNAESVSQQFGKMAVQFVTIFDGALPAFAAAVSARFQLPTRDVLHLLRSEFRKVRSDAAAAVRRVAAAVPGTIEQEIADPSEPPDAP